MAESDFNELLHAAEQLSAEVDGSHELPKVERSLRQVLEASTELWSRVTQTGAQDLQAHVLLGSKGVDLPQLSQKLETLSTRKTFEPLEPVAEADIQAFLKNELENSILSIIEETNRSAFVCAEQRMWDDVHGKWREEKLKALNALLGSSDDIASITAIPEFSHVAERGSRAKSQLNDLQATYAARIAEYNTLTVQGSIKPSLIDRFKVMFAEAHNSAAEELWEMADFMSKIPPTPSGDELKSRSSANVEQALVAQARKYLEKRYRTFMVSKVEANLMEARRGGQPGTLPLVLGYTKLCQAAVVPGLEDIRVQDQPLWPVVYFCLRAGKPSAALIALRQAGPIVEELASVLEDMLRNECEDRGPSTSTGLTAAWLTPNSMSSQQEQLLDSQYQQHVRLGTDPFKKAVYCSLLPCDTSEEHPLIVRTADDYLWMKLGQIRRLSERPSGGCRDLITYTQLQTLILEEYGETYYNAKMQPQLYFQMLFLTGQFEAALEFLCRQERLRVHGVHIALTFNELQLLALPPNAQTPILSSLPHDKPPSRRLNLARLLMLYVRNFEATDTKEALHYYYFLRNIKTPEGKNLFQVCVSDLVIEERNFEIVLGKMEADGCRTPGLIDVFQGVQADVKQVIDVVASEAEQKGLFEDAVHLYDLSGNHEKVLTLMASLLSQVANQTGGSGTVRTRLQEIAASITARYQGVQMNCSTKTSSTFFILHDIISFFDLYHAGEHQLALETINHAHLLPASMAEMEERVANFRHLGEEVCHCIPDVLLATMNILHSLYNWVKGGRTLSGYLKDATKEKQLAYLREKARCLTTFAGTVPYHMPGDTNSRLVQIEILMN